jgi:asparaginyl-tRNA synthetase
MIAEIIKVDSPRTNENLLKAKDKIISHFAMGCEKYLINKNFVKVFTPHLVGVTGACENLNTLFQIPYWGKTVFAAQTGQLYLELKTQLHDQVYCWLQSMRAEAESDGRHLTEFPLLEIEHKGNLDDLISNIQNIIVSGLNQVLDNCQEEIAELGLDQQYFRKLKFDRMTYSDAVDLLNEHGYPNLSFGDDLKREHELKITSLKGPVFVTHYPLEIKFFNMKQNDQDPRVVNSVDLLLPFSGESAGAAEREHEYGNIRQRLIDSSMYKMLTETLGLSIRDFDWYLDAHKDKEVNLHSGAGIGFARVLQFIFGKADIRDALQYPTDAACVW